MAYEEIVSIVIGEPMVSLLLASLIILLLVVLAIYFYFAIAWMTIARKMKYSKSWLAWIPIANLSMILQLGGFHWAWVFLIVIPILGWIPLIILLIIAQWKIFEERNYPGWFSLSMIIPSVGGILYLIVIGFVAWKDKKKEIRNSLKRKIKKKKR